MFETGADRLAIHVVACSAFNLLRELSKASGALFVEQVFRSVLSMPQPKGSAARRPACQSIPLSLSGSKESQLQSTPAK